LIKEGGVENRCLPIESFENKRPVPTAAIRTPPPLPQKQVEKESSATRVKSPFSNDSNAKTKNVFNSFCRLERGKGQGYDARNEGK